MAFPVYSRTDYSAEELTDDGVSDSKRVLYTNMTERPMAESLNKHSFVILKNI